MHQSSEADSSDTLENRNNPGIWKAHSWLPGRQVDQLGWLERSMQQRRGRCAARDPRRGRGSGSGFAPAAGE